MSFRLQYYNTVDADVETIQKWFNNAFGIKINKNQAVEFALYSLRTLSRLGLESLAKKRNVNYMLSSSVVMVQRDYTPDIERIRREVKNVKLGNQDVVSAVIAWRAVTLPRQESELKRSIRLAKKRKEDKWKYQPKVGFLPRDKKQTAHLVEASRNESTSTT